MRALRRAYKPSLSSPKNTVSNSIPAAMEDENLSYTKSVYNRGRDRDEVRRSILKEQVREELNQKVS